MHERVKRLERAEPGEVARLVIDEMSETCALDVADEGAHTLEQVSVHVGRITRERVRQLESKALRAITNQMRQVWDDDDVPPPEARQKRRARHGSVGLQLRRHMEDRGGPMRPDELARLLGSDSNNVRSVLAMLMRRGEVVRVSRGLYALVEAQR